ncbi:unnamed protein product [Cladocopium goreaui]|uniref:C3H1-type domain-containing protein n=1 Tax=Cladocopium goreaui TaxID=2562237 RepID=A0A9P1CQ53_9DINO|nr:unnamed protein product [Cladocopium goreaui]
MAVQWYDQAQLPQLPFWTNADETSDHVDTILEFHVSPCSDFQRGFCAKHGARAKANQCRSYHFESQRRRRAIDASTGQLTYWETPCPSWSLEMGCALAGDSCPLAHGREEVSFHPAKYKTRPCNGTDCRGEGACCFAHSDNELRQHAPARYSYFMISLGLSVLWHRACQSLRGSPSRGQGLPLKTRFCAFYPNISQCRRGAACSFAHTRDEVQTKLLSIEEEEHHESAMTQAFFTRLRTLSAAHLDCGAPMLTAQRASIDILLCCTVVDIQELLVIHWRTGAPDNVCVHSIIADLNTGSSGTSPDNHDYDHPLPAEVIDAAWADQFLNPPIFDNLDDEAGHVTQVIYEPAQANSNANPAPKKVLSKITIEKVKSSKVSSDPQKVTVSAAFALSKNCLLARDAKEENWANLDFYHHSASQRPLGQGDDSQRWWNMVNNAVTELL